MALLELREAAKSYRQGRGWNGGATVQALKGLSLKLEEGRCLAVIGPSGSGKSTLGRLALGLERPDSGSVLYKGRPLAALRGGGFATFRRNVQAVFQNSHDAVNPRFTVSRILAEPLRNFDRLSGARLEKECAALLEKVGLQPEMLGKYPHQLSGGELQRVCIARALAPRPEVVVLDEAVSALDMLSQSRILDLLAAVKNQTGASFIFISHDLKAVARLADSIAVVENGELAAQAGDLSDPAEMARLMTAPAMRRLAGAVLPARPA